MLGFEGGQKNSAPDVMRLSVPDSPGDIIHSMGTRNLKFLNNKNSASGVIRIIPSMGARNLIFK